MFLRYLYSICEICNHLKFYKPLFTSGSFDSFVLWVHGIILGEGNPNAKRISCILIKKKSSQALCYFLNHAKFSINRLSELRIKRLLKFALSLCKQEFAFFILDDTVFKKKKHKKTQGTGINYCQHSQSARRSQCFVMSSFLLNNVHTVFKTMSYVGERFIAKRLFKTKTTLALELLNRFAGFIEQHALKHYTWICLIDGGYTNSKVLQYIVGSCFAGFIGRYSKGRSVFIEGKKILLKKYIASLNIKQFKKVEIEGEIKLVFELMCDVIGSQNVKLVLIIDDSKNPKLSDIRPLITNVTKLSCEQIISFYALRWKQETYHQMIKDGFRARTHKIRKLSSYMKFLELIAVSYGLLEIRRHKLKSENKTVFAAKNELVEISKRSFLLNVRGNQIPKAMQDRVFEKFAA